jgi:hypothetical protein
MTQIPTTPLAEISLNNTNAPLFIYYFPYAQPHTPSIATISHLQQLPTPMDFPKNKNKNHAKHSFIKLVRLYTHQTFGSSNFLLTLTTFTIRKGT